MLIFPFCFEHPQSLSILSDGLKRSVKSDWFDWVRKSNLIELSPKNFSSECVRLLNLILYFLYFVAQIARIPSLLLKTNPFNAKTLSYAYLWVKEIAEKLEKSECWMVKWSSRNESFEDLETKGKTKSGMNKAVKIVLKG